MGYEKSDDYVEVNERILQFREKFPEGTLRQKSIEFRDVVSSDTVPKKGQYDPIKKTIVIYTAQAFRYPDDPNPGEGTAAELFPGKTPYTFDSEVQNAETAAWGRALIAVGAADAKQGLASAEEVRARQGTAEDSAPAENPALDAINRLKAAAKAIKVNVADQWAKDHDGEKVSEVRDIDKLIETAIKWELLADG